VWATVGEAHASPWRAGRLPRRRLRSSPPRSPRRLRQAGALAAPTVRRSPSPTDEHVSDCVAHGEPEVGTRLPGCCGISIASVGHAPLRRGRVQMGAVLDGGRPRCSGPLHPLVDRSLTTS
jgi:hypothetical protein